MRNHSAPPAHSPLTHNGLDCVGYQLYSNILENRLTQYLVMGQHIDDEQNGSRKKQACIDHNTLSTIIRTRTDKGISTSACFVDFQEAFDWINRDLFTFKCLDAGVDGRYDKSSRPCIVPSCLCWDQ